MSEEGVNVDEPPSPDGTWTVYRLDDNGNQFVVHRHLTHEQAKCLVAEFEARGHKQTYWSEQEEK